VGAALMSSPAQGSGRVSFGEFELDLETAELRCNGSKSILPGKPFQILTTLLDHTGQLVTREELKRQLWPSDTFVDFDVSLNKAVNRLREALGDSAEHPRFIETLPRKGYRFVGQVGNGAGSDTKTSADLIAASRVDEGFWVAVLPFAYSGNADLAALADGLSEDIVTGLSRFSYLRVIARISTLRYANQAIDVRSVGKELGARYVMEGSLRQEGTKLRLAVQLVDAVSGAHLWAENYEHTFSPDALFELQDDLVPRIVSTVADGYGILPYSMANLVRRKAPDELTPYEAFLSNYGYYSRGTTPEDHAAARACLELAVRRSPDYGDAWAALSSLYCDEFAFGFNPQPDSLGRALQAARRAVEAAPSNATAHEALAMALFFLKDFQACRSAAEQAISHNPMDGWILAGIGAILAYSGDWERGCGMVERAAQLNPRHPGWYWLPLFYNAYRKGDYRDAVTIGLRFNMHGFLGGHVAMAAAYGQMGESEAARKSLNEVLRLAPAYAISARERHAKWFAPELVEHLMDGLRKAGLEISDESAKSRPSSTDSV
jgi:TolB-like protein/Tfp pilus assembly protein PilF